MATREVDQMLTGHWFAGQAKPAVERALLMLNSASLAQDETLRSLASQDLLGALRAILESDILSLNQNTRAMIEDVLEVKL